MCKWFLLCTRHVFIRSIEVGGHFRTRSLGKRSSRPWSLSHIEFTEGSLFDLTNFNPRWIGGFSCFELSCWKCPFPTWKRSDRVWMQGQNTTTRSRVAIYFWCSCDLVKVDPTRIDHFRGKFGMKWLFCLALWFLQIVVFEVSIAPLHLHFAMQWKIYVFCWSLLQFMSSVFVILCIEAGTSQKGLQRLEHETLKQYLLNFNTLRVKIHLLTGDSPWERTEPGKVCGVGHGTFENWL